MTTITTLPHVDENRFPLPLLLISCLAVLFPTGAAAQTGEAGARPAVFRHGDRVAVVGNALAERMQHDGWLEALLQAGAPELGLGFRNLGFSADEFVVAQRTAGFGSRAEWLRRCRATLVVACFGFNESFRDDPDLLEFEQDMRAFIEDVRRSSKEGEAPRRLVFVSAIPLEDLGDPLLPPAAPRNVRLRACNERMRQVAAKEGIPVADAWGGMLRAYAANAGPLTINGLHLNAAGNRALAEAILEELVPDVLQRARRSPRLEALRQAIVRKNETWFGRYRVTDGYNVYGGRSSLEYVDDLSNFTVLQREMAILDAATERHDAFIRDLAAGRPAKLDLSGLPAPVPVKTNKPGKGPGGAHDFLDGHEAVALMTPAGGLEVKLFADEKRFPLLANPVQMSFDTRGRLWVAVWPTYPHRRPLEERSDKLVILEDRDGDGEADACRVFADGLHNPTGFEFWGGGVFVAQVPDLLFLKDTDGDGVADLRRRVLHGLSSGDTHHSANSFVIGPGGALYFQEGIFHQSQVETIRGPVRNRDACVWRFDPRTWRVERHVAYGFANPHGHVFDDFGQEFVTDGTSNYNYYALPFSGHVEAPDRHRGYFTFFKQRSRPAAATEILSSAHFPAAMRDQYLIANVIGFQGIFRYTIEDAGSGFSAREVEPLVRSSDPSFRPVDVETGPDGALYFLDWYNPLIGHMQHHLRDPSRDHTHGRVYRVTAQGRPLQQPAAIAGRPIADLLRILESRDLRVRYRARIELSDRRTADVLAAARRWTEELDPQAPRYEHHLLEALWLHQQHGVADEGLLRRMLRARDARVRAAATRVVRGWRELLHDPLSLLAAQIHDPHPRVRLEAVVAASSFEDPRAVEIALATLRHPMDRFLRYALKETLRTLEPVWRAALHAGRLPAAKHPEALRRIIARVAPDELNLLPRSAPVLQLLMERHDLPASSLAETAKTLATLQGRSVNSVLIESMKRVDRRGGRHAPHVLMRLGRLALAAGDPRSPESAAWAELARKGRRAVTRRLALAVQLRDSDAFQNLWRAAGPDQGVRLDLLEALAWVSDEAVLAQAATLVEPLVSAQDDAAHAREQRKAGLRFSWFDCRLENARDETFDRLRPTATGIVPAFSLQLPGVKLSDAFAARFEGSLRVPAGGSYRFFLTSDDGSRLYLGGRQIIENDGAHGMRERSGEIVLAAGEHAIRLDYFDQGGNEGLRLEWQGPGRAREQIPSEVLSPRAADPLRAAAIRAMARLPVGAGWRLRAATRLVREGLFVPEALRLAGAAVTENPPAAAAAELSATLLEHVTAMGPANSTSPAAVSALDLVLRLAAGLPGDGGARLAARARALRGTVILIRTVPHQMLYDRREFEVQAGKRVAIVFENDDVMPHNLVVARPGSLESVGLAAEALEGRPDAQARSFIPSVPEVLWSTRLLMPGESFRLEFTAPDRPGDHPYLCTYPGHWRVMNGVMHVVRELSRQEPAAVKPEAPAGPGRSFVRMWALADLARDFEGRWRRGRIRERGARVFREAGCIKCHAIKGEGATGSTDLTTIGQKYRGRVLLRHILQPSDSILEGYENWLIERDEGDDVMGRILSEDAKRVRVCPDLQKPENVVVVPVDDIVERTRLKSSAMPTGLLVTFTREEILDLIAWLESPR